MNNLQSDIQSLFAEGPEGVHVLADFDGTLTRDYNGDKKVPALISILRDHPGYLSPEYQASAHELANTYRPYEWDMTLPLEVRKSKMVEWWTKHKKLLIASGLKFEHIKKLAQSNHIHFRDGAVEFLQLMNKADIPVVIMSASGTGEAIQLFCSDKGVDFPNMHYISNKFHWDENGNAIGFQEPLIHSLNKDETVIQDFAEIYSEVKDRPNVLLLGNSTGDVKMVEGFDAKKVVKIGFLDPQEKEKLPVLEEVFDYVMVEEEYQGLNGAIKGVLEK